jgi:hypothetical protein
MPLFPTERQVKGVGGADNIIFVKEKRQLFSKI